MSLPIPFVIVLLVVSLAGAAAGLEDAPARRASDLFDAEVLKSRHHTVREDVSTHAFVRRYTIDSEYGVFSVDGDALLPIRVHEIGAIARLQAVSKLDNFGKGLEKAIMKPVFAVVGFAQAPVDTVTGVPKGVGRWFTRLGGMVTGQRGDLEESYAKELVGFSATKRQVCARLGVNPYSSNAELQRELNRTAWTMWLGGVAISGLFAAGNEPYLNAYMAVGVTQTLNQMLLDETPEDLQKRVRASLESMGMSSETIRRFLNNPVFSPAHELAISEALEGLEGVEGREDFIEEMSALSETESDALAYQLQAAMFAEYHDSVEPLAELLPVRQVFVGKTESARVAVVLPVDEVHWAQVVDEASEELSSRFAKVEIAISGVFTESAGKELEARGIAIRQKLAPTH